MSAAAETVDRERWRQQLERCVVEGLWWAVAGDEERLAEVFARFEQARAVLSGELGPVEQTPLWRDLAPWMEVQLYDRDGGHSRPRFRLELRSDTPRPLVDAALGLDALCCECGATIRPFRRRRGDDGAQGVYLAVACRLADSLPCSRGMSARLAYHRLRAAIEAAEPAPRTQLGLFGGGN